MKNNYKQKGGFTIIETLFGIAIFISITFVLTLFSKNVWVYNSFISEGLTNTDSVRQVLKTIVSEIRTASVASNGAYTIDEANASSFSFYSNIDDDNLREKIRYFLVGTTLQKGITKPTGSPPSYNPINEKIVTIASDTTNLDFSYFNKNYDGNNPALPFPINIPDVRLVKITVTIDKDPNRPPLPTVFSTQVSIRNLKDNL